VKKEELRGIEGRGQVFGEFFSILKNLEIIFECQNIT
jgi:hypothetical protein